MKTALAMALCALGLAAPAAATVYQLQFQGDANFFAPKVGYVNSYEVGLGSIDLADGQTEVNLGSGLRDFTFTTYLTEIVSDAIGTRAYRSTRLYTLADITSFSARANGVVVSPLNFTTSQGFNVVSNVGIDNSQGGGRPSIIGSISAAVPEPGMWAMMLIGFGVVGQALRRRPGRGVQQPA